MSLNKLTSLILLTLIPSLLCAPLRAQQVDVSTALAWPQFVVGPLDDGSSFEVELVVSNTSPTVAYSGELLLASQAFGPIDGIQVTSASGAFVQGGGRTSPAGEDSPEYRSPAFTQAGVVDLPPLASLKLRIFASSSLASSVTGFMLLNCLSGNNNQVVAGASFRRILNGVVLNSVPLLPVLAALNFYTTMCFVSGVNTGLAIASIQGSANVEVTAYPAVQQRSQDAGEKPLQAFYSGNLQVYGQTAQFPNEFIPDFPPEVRGGLLIVESDLPIWVTALDVISPPLSKEIEIGAKEVKAGSSGGSQ